MSDLRILFLTRKGDGYVGAPQTQYGFEQEVSNLCNCKFAGVGWKDHKEGELMSRTVKRVMPDADWVIDYNNHLHIKKPKGRKYKVGHFISDLHAKHKYKTGNPVEYVELINNANYDAVFMRYPLLYGTSHRPDIIYDRLKCGKHWVPWSVDTEYYRPTEKRIDVAFIGTLGKCYPLRKRIWEGIYYVARGNKIIRETSPKGKTYERVTADLIHKHMVGDKYRDALAETRIFLFGCSDYRYPLQKFFEATASECMVMSDAPGMSKKLGFVNEETYVELFEEDWDDRVLFALENPDLVAKIAKQGRENTVKEHSHAVRAKYFVEEVLQG